MTMIEEAPRVHNEEVLPLMQTLELDKPGRPHRHPLLRRIQQQLQHITPELLAIALVYFVQGILRLSSLAITFFEKDDLHMEPAQMALAETIAGLPWTVKPLYGFITDSFPIRGMRRQPYLVLAGLVGSASWLCLAAFASTIPAAIACITAAAASTAFSDVVADSIVVELARASSPKTDGALQSICWGAHAVGRIITAYLSGWLVDNAGVRVVFLITATFPLLVSLSSCLIKEGKLAGGAAAASQGQHHHEQDAPVCSQAAGHGSTSKTAAAPVGDNTPLLAGRDHPEISPATPLGATGVLEAGRHMQLTAVGSDSHAANMFEQQQQQQQQQWDDAVVSKSGSPDRHHLNHRLSSATHQWSVSSGGTPRFSSRVQPAGSPEPQQACTHPLVGSNSDADGKAKAPGSWCSRRQYMQQAFAGMGQSMRLFWNAVKQPHVLRPVLFLFLWQAMPAAGTAMFYFKTNQLHFEPEFFGRVKLVAALADLLGIVVYNSFLQQVRLRRLLLWGSFLGCALGLTPLMLVEGLNRKLGISDKVFALVDSALLSSIGQVLMMPTLVLSARLCPVGVEGTLYASLMSMNNFAAGMSDALGAVLMHLFGITSSNFTHLSALLLTCNILSLLPLPLIGWVPDETASDAAASPGIEHSAQHDACNAAESRTCNPPSDNAAGAVGIAIGHGCMKPESSRALKGAKYNGVPGAENTPLD